MSDNQQVPTIDLTKCCDCQKPFTKGQEYYELYRKDRAVMNFCLDCHKLYTEKKKVWEIQ